MNYPQLLERWSYHFPLRVRAYEAVRQGIKADNMQAIGAPYECLDLRRRVVNATPSDGAHQVMLWVNRLLPARLARKVHRVIRRTDWHLDALLSIDDVFRRYVRQVVQTWDREVMRRYLSEENLKVFYERLGECPARQGGDESVSPRSGLT